MRKLNVGCGTDIREGWVNLDNANIPGVDVVHNIEQLPLPFGDNMFDEVECQDILEHIDYPPVLKDIHRILAPGGVVHIRVPHFTSKNNAIDPQHIRTFSIETFDFFCKETVTYQRFGAYYVDRIAGPYRDFAFTSYVQGPHITFDTKNFWLDRLIQRIVNRSEQAQRRYESTWLSRIFPAMNIEVVLQK